MFVIYLLSVLPTVICDVSQSEATDEKALSNFNDFLQDLQQTIRFSQQMLNSVYMDIPTTEVIIKRNGDILSKYDRASQEYFSYNFVRFFNLTLTKNQDDVMKILKAGLTAANSLEKSGQIKLLEGSVKKKFFKFFQKLKSTSYAKLKNYLMLLRDHMQMRRKMCNAELNDVIDLANNLMDDEDDAQLTKVLDEFERFPLSNYNNTLISKDILEAFVKPFLKKTGTIELKRLFYYVNGILSFQAWPLLEKVQKNESDPLERAQEDYIKEPKEYLTGSFVKFFHLVAVKDTNQVMDVLKHSDNVIHAMFGDGKLKWLPESFKEVLWQLTAGLSQGQVNDLKEAALLFHENMKNRKVKFDHNINKVLDAANGFINKTDAQYLFTVVNNFETYPDTHQNGKELCRDIFEAFAAPYERIQHSDVFKSFVQEIDSLIKEESNKHEQDGTRKSPNTGQSRSKNLKKKKGVKKIYDMVSSFFKFF